MAGNQPNMLVILSDEHDPAVTGCYGHPSARTPHLDRLAAEGSVFERRFLEDLPFWHTTTARAPNRSREWRLTRPHVSCTHASEDEPDPDLRRHDTYDAEVMEHARRFLTEKAARAGAPGERPVFAELRTVVDPEAVDAAAKRDQARRGSTV